MSCNVVKAEDPSVLSRGDRSRGRRLVTAHPSNLQWSLSQKNTAMGG